MVDLVRAYSNHLNLANELVKTLQQLRQAQERGDDGAVSVRSNGRSDRLWRVNDRLSGDDVRMLVRSFAQGTTKRELAGRYGISESSVKRLLRRGREVSARRVQADPVEQLPVSPPSM